jgi:uncharacterized protein YjiS (DUF1127 family)
MAHVMTHDLGGTLGTGWLARARKALANRREYHDTVRELEALSDRELADLNLARFAIRDIAHDSVYGH